MPPSGASTSEIAWIPKAPVADFTPTRTFVLPIGAAVGVSVLVVSVVLLVSSLNVYNADLVEIGSQSEPKEYATFEAISVVPLVEQLMPAALTSGARLKRRILLV
eukprot:SAG25_NODE_925_length_4735_cov_64.253236_2_plen_105_part_00